MSVSRSHKCGQKGYFRCFWRFKIAKFSSEFLNIAEIGCLTLRVDLTPTFIQQKKN